MYDTIVIAAPPGAVSLRPSEVNEVILLLAVFLLDVDDVTVLAVELPV